MSKPFPETFCPNPWVQICSTPTSSLGVCGEAREFDRDIPLQDFFSSPRLRELRRALANGERPAHCSSCWMQEEQGRLSTRKFTLNLYNNKLGNEALHQLLEESRANHFVVQKPLKVDIKSSSHCNLACRMCASDNSSKLWREYDANREALKDFEYYYEFARPQYAKEAKRYDINEWLQVSDQIKYLNISGGEPTLHPEVLQLLESYEKSGYADKIEVTFNSNGTHFNEELFNKLKSYREVRIYMSLDGTGSIYEYIRYPGKWEHTRHSIPRIKEFFADSPHVEIYVSPTYQILNILNLTDIYRWCDSLDLEWLNDSFVTDPLFQNAAILPFEIRQLAAERLQAYYQEREGRLTSLQARALPNTIKHLLHQGETHRKNIDEFWKHTRITDRIRKQSFEQSCPELYELLQKTMPEVRSAELFP